MAYGWVKLADYRTEAAEGEEEEMTRATIRLEGQDKLEDRINETYRMFKSRVAQAGKEVTAKMVAKAKHFVPVDTGALRNSIKRIDPVIKPRHVEFGFSAGGDNVDYARHVEWGTYKMMPQPYMRPAAQSQHAALLKRLKEAGKLR